MAGPLPVTSSDFSQYLSPDELFRLDRRLDYALCDATFLVFWTGVPPQLAKQWANQQGLQTLTLAMGPKKHGPNICKELPLDLQSMHVAAVDRRLSSLIRHQIFTVQGRGLITNIWKNQF